MTSEQARKLLIEQLSPRYGEGEARSIARIVFEDAFDRGLDFESSRFETILQRLTAGMPVQYVLGTADFFGLKFTVSPAVLIPRQETEELVAWVLEDLKSWPNDSAPNLLDIGLGSGCIGIALKKKHPSLRLFGLEKSPEALAVASENASRILQVPVAQNHHTQFHQGDILNRSDWAQFPAMDMVVSNPPYIPYSEKGLVPEHVIAHEPALALFVDNPDALLFYRRIAEFCGEKLRPGGSVFFECNEFNATEVAKMLWEKGFANVETRKDLSGADRMVKGVLDSR